MHNLERQREAEGSAAWQGLAKAKVISGWGGGAVGGQQNEEGTGTPEEEVGLSSDAVDRLKP